MEREKWESDIKTRVRYVICRTIMTECLNHYWIN